MKYYVQVEEEKQYYCLYFPQAPGCQTFAEDRAEMSGMAADALEGWLFSGGQPIEIKDFAAEKISDDDFWIEI